jgi:regulator of sigma E protease
MIYSILYAVLAALALGILVFVHELGHYLMARREGMRVEAFSIGFGKPIFSWLRDGVQWQFCWIPFGGYVKIAGMEKQGVLEPYQIEDGFYGKGPWSRIKVALAGPVVNIVLAFIVFSFIWMTGGRDKPFTECTHLIGWVEPASALYKEGMRPGDQINTYGNEPFTGFRQLATAALLDQGPYSITGEKFNYLQGTVSPFSYSLDLGDSLTGLDKMSLALRMMAPASYLIYDEKLGSLEDSPMEESGLKSKDRVIWVDGELVFSRHQLSSLINQSKALLTVSRGDKVFITRIPRLQIRDLRLNSTEKAELQDISYALKIDEPFAGLYFIPYNLTEGCVVDDPVPYIDDLAIEREAFEPSKSSDLEIPLQAGDRILSVDGTSISSIQSLFSSLQKRQVQMVVVRGGSYPSVSASVADEKFMDNISFKDLQTMVKSIGSADRISSIGNLHLLNPITPKPRYEFPLTYSIKDRVKNAVVSQKSQKKGKASSDEAASALRAVEANQKQLMLGLPLQDRLVKYNPSPFHLMGASLQEAWKMIYALVTGYASPKYLAGPVGIVQVIHYGWGQGVKEVLFLVAAISFNLGIVNLLPIPVLDGGHICFALYEMITKKRIKAKTMEKLIIPFIILFIAFFVYLTYQDLYRLLGKFF